MKNLTLLLIATIVYYTPALCSGQQLALLDADTSVARTAPAGAIVTAPAPAPAEGKPLTARWLDLAALSHSERYRSAFDQDRYHVYEDGQQRSLAEGRFRFDAAGHYTLGFRASSGRYFNWAYADYAGRGISARTGPYGNAPAFTPPALGYEIYQAILADPAGTITFSRLPSTGWEFYVRDLFLSATPIPAVTVEFGSFSLDHGVSSEITTFDDDGYISGERVRLQDAGHLWLDEVAFTNAFFGAFGNPNLFSRGLALGSSNYRQLLLKKHVNAAITASGDYTWLSGTHSLHEAVIFAAPKLKVVDSIHVEAYQRLNTVTLQGFAVGGGRGFAVTVDKQVHHGIDLGAGFASVDRDYSVYTGSRFAHAVGFSLNGDSYSMGKRPFLHASVRLTRELTAFGFYTHEVGPFTSNLDQQNLNGGLTVDLKALLNTRRAIF